MSKYDDEVNRIATKMAKSKNVNMDKFGLRTQYEMISVYTPLAKICLEEMKHSFICGYGGCVLDAERGKNAEGVNYLQELGLIP